MCKLYNIKDLLSSNHEIVVFGAGTYGKIGLKLLKYLGYGNRVKAFCDNDERKHGNSIDNIGIFSYKSIKERYNNVLFVICSVWSEEIRRELIEKGESQIFVLDYNEYIDNEGAWLRKLTDCQSLIVDVVDSCNLHCKSCPRGRRTMENTNNKMDIDLFKKIIDKSKNEGYKDISLYNWSEPLLHSELDKFIEYAKYKSMSVSISTNLSISNIDNLLKCFDSGLDACYVTVSGYNQSTHSINHIGSNIEVVKNNLKKLTDYLKEKNINTFRVFVKYLEFNYNKNEEKDFQNLCDKLNISFLKVNAGNDICNDVKSEDIEWDNLSLKKNIPVNPICNFIFSSTPIDYNGNIYTCCISSNSPLSYVGNYLEMSSEEIFFNRVFNPKCSLCKSKVPSYLPVKFNKEMVYDPILAAMNKMNEKITDKEL